MAAADEAIAQGREARKQKDLDAARAHYAEAAAIYRDERDPLGYAHTIRHIADMHLDELNLDEAKPLYEEALELYRGNLNTKLLDLANTVRPYALLKEKAGELNEARELWREARNLYRSLRIEAGVNECGAHLEKLGEA